MAEGWVRHDLGERVEVHSAGIAPCFVHPLAIQVMGEVGVDLSGHRSKSVAEFRGQSFDLVVTVCDSARDACPVFLGATQTIHEPIPDPVTYGFSGDYAEEKFREVRDVIRKCIVPLVRRELKLGP